MKRPRHLATLAFVGVSVTLAAGPVAASKAERAFQSLGFERSVNPGQLLRDTRAQPNEASAAGDLDRKSGPTIRRIQQNPAVPASIARRRARYQTLIDREAVRHGLQPELLHAVIRAESSYRPRAKSHAGACGLMQLMPATARRFGVSDIWDPGQNIRGGAAYLRFLMDRFDGDIRLVVAAYNAGEGAVAKYGNRVPPYRETQGYVKRVLGYLRVG
jgi:soluble lytic murein transglycosylase-like protein